MPASAMSRARREVSDMETTLRDAYVTLADAFAYPAPGTAGGAETRWGCDASRRREGRVCGLSRRD